MTKFKTFIYAVSVLAGTIIGVGLFGLPYIAAKVGFWVMAGYFLVLGFLSILIHLFFGEVALKTPDFKRFPGFAANHLRNWGRNIALVSTVLGLMGAILAYLIVGGEFLKEILFPVFGGHANFYTIIYFVFGAAMIYWGVRAIAAVEQYSWINGTLRRTRLLSSKSDNESQLCGTRQLIYSALLCRPASAMLRQTNADPTSGYDGI